VPASDKAACSSTRDAHALYKQNFVSKTFMGIILGTGGKLHRAFFCICLKHKAKLAESCNPTVQMRGRERDAVQSSAKRAWKA